MPTCLNKELHLAYGASKVKHKQSIPRIEIPEIRFISREVQYTSTLLKCLLNLLNIFDSLIML